MILNCKSEENGLCGLASALVRLGGNRDKIGLMDCGMQPARSAQSKEDRDNSMSDREFGGQSYASPIHPSWLTNF